MQDKFKKSMDDYVEILIIEKLKSIREDERKRFLNKACEYLESALKPDLGYYGAAEFADTFRKAMEE